MSEIKTPEFRINDHVYVSKANHVFEQGFTLNWSAEVFTMDPVASTSLITSHLKDYMGQSIARCFYTAELSKVKHADFYLVKEIIKKRDGKFLVKCLRLDFQSKEKEKR